jgi:predicted nuclease of predicted toxin-antitoxin system
LKFLVDNQLPARLARWLREAGLEANHVMELRLDEADDRTVIEEALARDMILVSKDADFLDLVNRPGCAGRLVWVRVGNCRSRVLIETFKRAFPLLLGELAAGAKVVELR